MDTSYGLEDHVSRRVVRDALIRDALMDLGGWLRSLGLEQYEATFRENEIDDTVLPRSTTRRLRIFIAETTGQQTQKPANLFR
jgi:hypothetical protein